MASKAFKVAREAFANACEALRGHVKVSEPAYEAI
jgi:hypothetical protein